MLRQSDIVILKNEYKGFLTLLGNEEVISIIFSPTGARDAKQLYKKNYKKGYVYPFDYDWSIDKIYRPVDADSLGEWIAGTKSLDDENEFALVWDREKAPPMPVPLPSVGAADVGKVLMVDQEGEWSTSAGRQDVFTIHWEGAETVLETAEEIYKAFAEHRKIQIVYTEFAFDDSSNDQTIPLNYSINRKLVAEYMAEARMDNAWDVDDDSTIHSTFFFIRAYIEDEEYKVQLGRTMMDIQVTLV